MKRFNIYHLRFFVFSVISCLLVLSVFLFAEKVCPKCGRKYPDTDNFCAYCESEDGSAVKLVKYRKNKPPETKKGIWLDCESLIQSRWGASGCVVGDKLYLIGGRSSDLALDRIDEYDPAKDEWRFVTLCQIPRFFHTSVEAFGRIYIFGGRSLGKNRHEVEEFDPLSGRSKIISYWKDPRFGISSVQKDGKIFVLGGVDSSFNITPKVDIFDLATSEWQQGVPMQEERAFFSCIIYKNKLYVFGGVNEKHGISNSVEVFDFTTKQWRKLRPMPIARAGCGCAIINNSIFIIGGFTAKEWLSDDCLSYHPQTGTWQIQTALPSRTMFPCVFSLKNKLYTIEGIGQGTRFGLTIIPYCGGQMWRYEYAK